MKASTARALRDEARKIRSMKEHVARWQHQQTCEACKSGVGHDSIVEIKKPTLN